MNINLLKIDKEIKEIDQNLFKIKDKIGYIQYFYPINYEQEKEKFFKNFHNGKKYNPNFKYKTIQKKEYVFLKKELEDIKKKLRKIKKRNLNNLKNINIKIEKKDNNRKDINNSIFEINLDLIKIFTFYVKDLEERLELVYNLGNDKNISRIVKKVFGKLDKKLIQKSEKNITNTGKIFPTSCNDVILKKEVEKIIDDFLIKFNLKNWKVKFRAATAYAWVDNVKSILYVKNSKEYSKSLIEVILYHEILGHALQGERAKENGLKIFESGFGFYELISEGYALYQEGKINPYLENRLYIYYLGTYIASKKSFYDTFVFMLQYLNLDDAYMITARLKEGFKDTSIKGSFMKDKSYLEGYEFVKKIENTEDFNLVSSMNYDTKFCNEVRKIYSFLLREG